jgi:hypothetical protein
MTKDIKSSKDRKKSLMEGKDTASTLNHCTCRILGMKAVLSYTWPAISKKNRRIEKNREKIEIENRDKIMIKYEK